MIKAVTSESSQEDKMHMRMSVKIYSTIVFELGMGKRNQKDGGTIMIKKHRSGNRTR